MLPPFAATPPGALDLTGDAARRRRQLQRGAAAALERAGYQELIPPSFEYEDVFLRGYETVPELERGLKAYFTFYNDERPHQSLGYRTPAAVYRGSSSRARLIFMTGDVIWIAERGAGKAVSIPMPK